jgi:hypothetical protein
VSTSLPKERTDWRMKPLLREGVSGMHDGCRYVYEFKALASVSYGGY